MTCSFSSYADIERQGGSGGGGGGGGISGLVADAVGRSVASVAKSADLAGGVAWALAGALFYAVYIVLLRSGPQRLLAICCKQDFFDFRT